MKKRIIILGLILVVGGMGFTLVKDKDLAIVKSLDIYCTLFRELNMFYVDDIDPEELVETSIVSMLKSLDPYTTYIPEKNMDDFNFQQDISCLQTGFCRREIFIGFCDHCIIT